MYVELIAVGRGSDCLLCRQLAEALNQASMGIAILQGELAIAHEELEEFEEEWELLLEESDEEESSGTNS